MGNFMSSHRRGESRGDSRFAVEYAAGAAPSSSQHVPANNHIGRNYGMGNSAADHRWAKYENQAVKNPYPKKSPVEAA
jgi:hypothetical protein